MNSRLLNLFVTSLLLLVLPGMAYAQHDAGIPQVEDVASLYPGKAYSPWAERSFPSRVYWGETHLHTGLSLDAGLFGNTTGHDTAYRLARGEEVVSAGGRAVRQTFWRFRRARNGPKVSRRAVRRLQRPRST
jgi:hypothetical protein